MNRFPNKNGSKFGYQKTPTVASSRKDKGVVDASNITMIKDVDPMLDNITVHGRCISLWHSHRMNQAHNPYSLDMVLQDSQNSRIQVYIKKEWMFRFEPLFQEGQCYAISNFAIAENSGKLPLLPHKYKISFYKGTVVTRIDSFDNNVNGFILEPFNRLLDGTRQYHEHEAVGSCVRLLLAEKIRRVVVVEDSESNQLDCIFWDQWVNMWDEYAVKRDELGHVVFILQLGKVKYWDGTPSIHNALFRTKMFINRDLPEILSFRQRLKELPEYDESQFKISLFTPQKSVVTIVEFFNGAVKKMVSSIRECDQEYNKSKSNKGYHVVPLPFTGNFIPRKPDLMFMDEIVESENMDVTTVVTPSDVKKVKSKHESANVKNKGVEPKTVRKNSFIPPIIED
ncbi:replication protein A 70 kDa DNA-binding subunit B [Tanacetum coccineum]|uniref:Replication protein A 70 kDa DNA-binding subunit B n=1 Tax=Tanacetum coccineum TaxID=301880 RepID=A0ABQ5DFP3_9ASTR